MNTIVMHCSRTNQVAKYICFEILQIYFKTCIFLYSTLTIDYTIWIFHYFFIFCFALPPQNKDLFCVLQRHLWSRFEIIIFFLPYIFSSSDFEEIFFTLEIYCREKIFKLVNVMCRLCIMCTDADRGTWIKLTLIWFDCLTCPTCTINMYLLLKQARHSTALLPPFKNPVANGTVGG